MITSFLTAVLGMTAIVAGWLLVQFVGRRPGDLAMGNDLPRGCFGCHGCGRKGESTTDPWSDPESSQDDDTGIDGEIVR
jgi:hypothetical protein